MTLDAPEPIAAYLAAEEAKDADAVSRCFTEDGTVHDEGRDIAVVTRSANGSKRRTRIPIRSEMVNAQTHGNEVTVRARLTGEFPGSPLNWTTSSNFPTTRCFAGDSIMTMTYPFPFRR